MDAELTKLRNTWEKGLDCKCVVHNGNEYYPVYRAVLWQDATARWSVNRYFRVGGKWTVSCDTRGEGTLDAVWQSLQTEE